MYCDIDLSSFQWALSMTALTRRRAAATELDYFLRLDFTRHLPDASRSARR
ncbi:MAG: hypothetical protein ABI573_07410 [Chloroflexota bacterium]